MTVQCNTALFIPWLTGNVLPLAGNIIHTQIYRNSNFAVYLKRERKRERQTARQTKNQSIRCCLCSKSERERERGRQTERQTISPFGVASVRKARERERARQTEFVFYQGEMMTTITNTFMYVVLISTAQCFCH